MYNLMAVLYNEQNENFSNRRRNAFDLGSRPFQEPLIRLSISFEKTSKSKICYLLHKVCFSSLESSRSIPPLFA